MEKQPKPLAEQIKETQHNMTEHLRKMETDPEYRAKAEQAERWINKFFISDPED